MNLIMQVFPTIFTVLASIHSGEDHTLRMATDISTPEEGGVREAKNGPISTWNFGRASAGVSETRITRLADLQAGQIFIPFRSAREYLTNNVQCDAIWVFTGELFTCGSAGAI
jgi:hypothetical protein